MAACRFEPHALTDATSLGAPANWIRFYPLQLVRSEARFLQSDGRRFARLKPGVTLEQANADVRRMIPPEA